MRLTPVDTLDGVVDRVESIKDERIAAARALVTRSGRESAGRCLVEGPVLISQLVTAGVAVEYVLRPDGADDPDCLAALAEAGVPVWPVREGLLRKVTGRARPSDWLAVVTLPSETAAAREYGDFAIVCERIVDPGNLGTIVRTASTLGADDIVVTDEQTDVFSRKVVHAARGAVFGSRVHRFATPGDAVASLREQGFQIVATSPRGAHVQSLAPLAGGRVALVVGNETDGVCEETLSVADLVVQIPMAGDAESLNVGVAAGISIYELRMRMVMATLTHRIGDTLGRNLGAAAVLARRALDAELQSVGDLSADEAVLLMILACDRTTPRERLAREIGVGDHEMTTLLDRLAKHGYLTADAESATITSHGERAVAAVWTIQERVDDDLCEGFSHAERAQLQDLLIRVQDNGLRLARAGSTR